VGIKEGGADGEEEEVGNAPTSSAFQRCLYSAMFLLAFYGFFRVGELTAKSMDSADSVLQFNDLKF